MTQNRPAWHSLKTRTALILLAVLLTGLWTLTLFVSTNLRSELKQALSAQQSIVATVAAVEIDYELRSRLDALQIAATALATASPSNPESVQKTLEMQYTAHPLFNGGLIAFDRRGTAIADYPPAPGRRGTNYMDVDVVATALNENKASIGRPLFGKKIAAPLFGIGVPVHDDEGQLIGAVTGVINLEQPNFISRLIGEGRQEQGSHLLLVSPQHRLIISASDKTRTLETLPPPGEAPAIDKFLAGVSQSEILINPKGIEVLSTVRPIPAAGWLLIASLPSVEAFAPADQLQRRMLIASTLLSLIGCGLGWWLLRRQLAPVTAAAERLEAMSLSGEALRPLPIKHNDEVGQLISSFNSSLMALNDKDAALRASEERLALATESAQIGIWDYTIHENRLIWDPLMFRIYGIDPMHFDGTYMNWLQAVHPKDRDRVIATFDAAVHEQQPFVCEYRVKWPSGDTRHVTANGQVILDSQGQPVRVIGVSFDITERRQAELARAETEQRFLDMVNSTDGIVWEADAITFDFTFVSQQAERLLGYPTSDWHRPGFWVNNLHPDDKSWAPAYCASCTGKLEAHNFEYRFIAKDGRTVWLHDIVTVTSENGEPRWLRGIMVDITKQKAAEAELEHHRARLEQLVLERTAELTEKNRLLEDAMSRLHLAQAELVQASKLASLGELVAGISHELNTPIGNARMVASTLNVKSEAFRTHLDDVGTIRKSELRNLLIQIDEGTQLLEHSLVRADELIQSFKQVAVDRSSSQRRQFDLSTVTAEILGTLAPRLLLSTYTIENNVAPDIHLDSYPGPYGQVLVNLIDNALIHGLQGRPQGSIRIHGQRHGENAIIEVSDDGCGIPSENLPRVFDPFFTTRFGQGGSGLGLHIVFNIVTGLLGGKITVSSPPGQGACFTLTLPLVAPLTTIDQPPAANP